MFGNGKSMIKKEYDYIIVGAGLCGLVLAKELNKKGRSILILEKGDFITKMGLIRHAIFFYDKGALARSRQGVIIYRAFGVGGTSIVSCGNAVEFTEEEYDRIGIDLRNELIEAKKECCVQDKGLPIGKASAKIMEVANRLGYDMKPMPKFNINRKCTSCGECVVGCIYNAKWTSKECVKELAKENVDLLTKFSVKKVLSANGRAIGVEGVGKKIGNQK